MLRARAAFKAKIALEALNDDFRIYDLQGKPPEISVSEI